MKRVNKDWWKGADGYYKEIQAHVFEGPFKSIEDDIRFTISLDEEVIIEDDLNIVVIDDQVMLKPNKNMF